METKTFYIQELFSISFSDNSKVWGSYNVEHGKPRFEALSYSYFDKGLNQIFIQEVKTIQSDKMVPFLEEFCRDNEKVMNFNINSHPV